MLDIQRNVSGIGSGAHDDPFVQMAIPLKQGLNDLNKNIKYPYEIDNFKKQLFEIFEKVLILRNQLNQALENPSVKQSQKVGLDKSINAMDDINSKILQIPEFLSLFSVDS